MSVCVISILLLFTFHLVRLDCFFSACFFYCYCCGLEAWHQMSNIHFLCDSNRDKYCFWNDFFDWLTTHCFITWFIQYIVFFSHEIQLIPTGMGQFEIMHKKRLAEKQQKIQFSTHINNLGFRFFFQFATGNRNTINVPPCT